MVEAGCRFVRGPIPAANGEVVVQIGARLYSVWPHIDGRSAADGKYLSDDDRRAVLSALVDLHAMDTTRFKVDEELFQPDNRRFLERVIDEPGDGWDRGPYGERARALLDQCAPGVSRLLAHYDDLVTKAPRRDAWILTHGEPHMANVVVTAEGPVLIDWDTVAIAPRERDLSMVVTPDAHVSIAYSERAGHEPNQNMLKLYWAQWELTEIGVFLNHFHNPHGDDPDDVVGWKVLSGYLPIEPRWPEL